MSWPDAPSKRSACSRSAVLAASGHIGDEVRGGGQRLGAGSGRAGHGRQQFCRRVARDRADRSCGAAYDYAICVGGARLSRASRPRRRAGSRHGRPRGGRRTPRRGLRAPAPTRWGRRGRSGRRARRRRRAPPATSAQNAWWLEGACGSASAPSTGSNVSRVLGGRPRVLLCGRGLAVRLVAVGGTGYVSDCPVCAYAPVANAAVSAAVSGWASSSAGRAGRGGRAVIGRIGRALRCAAISRRPVKSSAKTGMNGR